MLLLTSRAALLGLALVGGYALHVFSESNGLFPTAKTAQAHGKFPDGPTYQPAITGNEGVDNILNLLLQFFWPVVDGKHLDAAVISAVLGAQGTAAFTLIVIEGLRYGNRGRIVSFTITTGMLIQTLGFGLIGPAYLLLHSITVPPGKGLDIKALSASESHLNAVPASQLVGFILPTIAMALPSPAVLSTSQKIAAILFWQFFPLWSALFVGFVGRANAASKNATVSNTRTLKALRGVYRFALSAAAIGHLAVLGLSLTAYFRPDVIGETYAGYLQPAYLYIPQNPFDQATKISSIAEGAFWFLQWDTVATTLAFLIWGVSVKYTTVTNVSLFTVVWDVVVRPVVFGPAGAALALVWDRDEFVFAGGNAAVSKKHQ